MAVVTRVGALVCFCVILGSVVHQSHGLLISGVVQTKNDWKFLTRFCFLSKIGRLRYELQYPKNYEVQSLIFYFDNDDQWPAVYPTSESTSCVFKESVLKPNNNQKLWLTPVYSWSGCTEIMFDQTPYYNCTGTRSFESMRERWWYIALDNCNSTKGLAMYYRIHMTNGEEDDVFFTEFSADEFYILQIDIAFFVVYVIVLLFTISIAATLYGRQMFHTTYKMFTYSVGFEVASLIFMIGYYGSYANTGIPKESVRTIGRILDATSNLIFLLMLILMAKGYTITRGRLSSSGSVKIAVFMTVYVVAFIVLFVWDAQWSDPGLVLYIYDSPPGYGLIAMRLLAWAWFCYALAFTIKHHPERRKFFWVFAGFFTVWFWAGPMVILIAMTAMYAWVRQKVVSAVELCVMLCGHVAFLIITRPSAANENFPYHIRTTQIGIITETSNVDLPTASQGVIDNPAFSGSSYAVPSETPSFYETNYAAMFSAHRSDSREGQSAINSRS